MSQQRQCVIDRLFGKASHRLSLPNLANMSIFKSDSADVDDNEMGQLQLFALSSIILSNFCFVSRCFGVDNDLART